MSATPVIDHFIPVAGGRLFAREWPATNAALAPLVLLHESLGCVAMWKAFPEALARDSGRRVIAYDRLGFGRSTARDALPDPRFIEDEAGRCLPALLQALGVEACIPFGHSVGGGMALTFAALRPELCRAVITESAQAFVEPLTLAGVRRAKALFGEPEAFSRLARYHGDKTRWVLDAWTETWLSPAFADWSLDPWLPRVRCPVLAIHGDADEYGSVAFPRRIIGRVAGPAQMVLLEGCGHLPHREREAEVVARVAAFLAALPD